MNTKMRILSFGPRVVSFLGATRAAPLSPPPRPSSRPPLHLAAAGAEHRKPVCMLGRRQRGFLPSAWGGSAPIYDASALGMVAAAVARVARGGGSGVLGTESGAPGPDLRGGNGAAWSLAGGGALLPWDVLTVVLRECAAPLLVRRPSPHYNHHSP